MSLQFQFSFKNIVRVVLDVTLILVAFIAATYLRLSSALDAETSVYILETQLESIILIVLAVKLLCLYLGGVYQKFWRYTKLADIQHLTQLMLISGIVLALPRLFNITPKAQNFLAISYGVILIDFFISVILLSTIRLMREAISNFINIRRRQKLESSSTKNTLLLGAGDAGIEVLNAIISHPELGIKVKAVLDDDKSKHGMKLASGVFVKASINDLKHHVEAFNIEQVIIAIPSLTGQRRKEVIDLCASTSCEIRIVPMVGDLAGGHVRLEEIRELKMEDLLGRGEIDLKLPEVSSFLHAKKVLVTGAGGSIGSELCRQIFKHGQISSICLLGKGENSVFESWKSLENLQAELQNYAAETYAKAGFKPWDIKIELRICDIRNYQRLADIFNEFKPEVVFHAAAHKHVYLMELNASEAFETNVIGSKNLMELSAFNQVENFVQISTDKAVNPTSIMGTTKKYAEHALVHTAKAYPQTKFTAVRFGNVLGSRGSVITIWQKQIKSSRLISVTHKEAIRYFMTIPEASQLVIKSAAKAKSGEIMVLDMGEPINIYALAEQFIKLSGYKDDEVQIKITGLRPGEKLYEELLTADEFVDSQLTDKIFKAKIDNTFSEIQFKEIISEFKELAARNENEKLKAKLRAYLTSRV